MAPPICMPALRLPTPPTTTPSCAVPIGGSNTTLLDTCCNGHIHPIRTYATNDCYLYCTTDNAGSAQRCLEENMGRYDGEGEAFRCFNVGVGVGSAAARRGGRWKWRVGALVGVWVFGGVFGEVL